MKLIACCYLGLLFGCVFFSWFMVVAFVGGLVSIVCYVVFPVSCLVYLQVLVVVWLGCASCCVVVAVIVVFCDCFYLLWFRLLGLLCLLFSYSLWFAFDLGVCVEICLVVLWWFVFVLVFVLVLLVVVL